MPDPLAAVRELRRRLEAAAAARGLTLVSFALPDVDEPPDVFVAVFVASEQELRTSIEQLATNAAFAEIEQGERDLADQQAIADARAELRRRLSEGGDLLG